MRVGIVGGGFGLYGFLPAVAERPDDTIFTLDRYRRTVQTRPDLAAFQDRVSFKPDIPGLADVCDTLIIAVPPLEQQAIVEDLLRSQWCGNLILEKPLTPDPNSTLDLTERLINSRLSFRIDFTFTVTNWCKALARTLDHDGTSASQVGITWRFLAHHYRHEHETWKRYHRLGGGALRFYCIHTLGLLAALGDWTPVECQRALESNGEEAACHFSVRSGNTEVSVICDTRWSGQSQFQVSSGRAKAEKVLFQADDPFSEELSPADLSVGVRDRVLDRRTIYLRRLLDTMEDDSQETYRGYLRFAYLWRDLEALVA
jgi:predicted dehydrogenase